VKPLAAAAVEKMHLGRDASLADREVVKLKLIPRHFCQTGNLDLDGPLCLQSFSGLRLVIHRQLRCIAVIPNDEPTHALLVLVKEIGDL